ncbi:MAG: ABC transporter ATP-binding protein [Capsulimonas sp.]|uniref:ABC transporter ATP-binding protein n=1 Tax=Capsulimonas sp. TaxID=2494211 RepID=UPI003263FB87
MPKRLDNTVKMRWAHVPRLMALLWKVGRRELTVVAALALLSGLTPIAQIAALARFIDSAVPLMKGSAPVVSALPWLALLVVTHLFGHLVLRLSIWIQDNAQEALKARLQERLLEKAARLPLASFETPAYYNLLQQAQKALDEHLLTLLGSLMEVAPSTISVLGLLVYAAAGSPWFPLLLMLGTVPAVILRVRLMRTMFLVEREQLPAERSLSYIEDLLVSRPAAAEIKLFALQSHLMGKRLQLYDSLAETRITLESDRVKQGLRADFFQYLSFGAVLIGVLSRLAHGSITIGQCAGNISAILEFQRSLVTLFWRIAVVDNDTRYIADLFAYLDLDEISVAPKTMDGEAAASKAVKPVPEIRFENVSMRYPGSETDVLTEINLTIRAGERIALVGENGAGKTTLCKLILGLYEPTSGRILVDGEASTGVSALRGRGAAIFQEFMRYEVTVRENIGFGEVTALDDGARIRAAAARSGVAATIDGMPEAYNTILGKSFDENGRDLSGGEWQKLAVARAYFREAAVLVLDEPTSALDAKAEVVIYRQFEEISAGKSVLLVSHRLGCTKLADRIVVLEQGRIVEQGTYSELLAQGDVFARMYAMQAQWYV